MASRAASGLSPLVIAALHLCSALAIASASSDATTATTGDAGAARSTGVPVSPSLARGADALGGGLAEVIGAVPGDTATVETVGIPRPGGGGPATRDGDGGTRGTHAEDDPPAGSAKAPRSKRAAASTDADGGDHVTSEQAGSAGVKPRRSRRRSRPRSKHAQTSPRRARAKVAQHGDTTQSPGPRAAGRKRGRRPQQQRRGSAWKRSSGGGEGGGEAGLPTGAPERREADSGAGSAAGATCLDTSTPGQCQPVDVDGPPDSGPLGRVSGIQPQPESWLAQAHETVVRVPVTVANTVAVLVLLGLAVLGSVYIYKLCTQPHCSCPMCEGDYVVKGTLGTGGFGSVYRVTRAVDKKDFVLKKIPVTDINDANDAHTEARELRFLQHPRIVGYEDDFMHTTPQSAGRDAHIYVCIIMELCERDLRQLLELKRDNGAGVSEEQLLKYLAQICSALSYCHGKLIIHRDIKPQNVFLDADDNVRLGDFGLCKAFRKAFTSYTDAGTDCYKAPETLLGGRRDGRKSDVWSLGLLLHEMTTLTLAWERGEVFGAQLLHYPSALDDIMRLVPTTYSPAFRRLMRRMLHPTAASRPTADDILGMKLLRRAVRADAKLRKKLNKQVKQAAESLGNDDNGEPVLAPRRWGKRGAASARSGSHAVSTSGTSPNGADNSGGSGSASGDGAPDATASDDSGFFGIVRELMSDDDSDGASRVRRRRRRGGPRSGSSEDEEDGDSEGAGRPARARAHVSAGAGAGVRTPGAPTMPATPGSAGPLSAAAATGGGGRVARSASVPRPAAARHRKRARKKAKGGLNRRPPGTVAALNGAAVYAALQAAGPSSAAGRGANGRGASARPKSADAAVLIAAAAAAPTAATDHSEALASAAPTQAGSASVTAASTVGPVVSVA